MGPRTGLEALENRKISYPCPESVVLFAAYIVVFCTDRAICRLNDSGREKNLQVFPLQIKLIKLIPGHRAESAVSERRRN